MIEGVATTTPLNPLMQSWLDDVSSLLGQLNEMGKALEQKEKFYAPEVVEELRRTISGLQNEIAKKNSEIENQKNAEKILRNSVEALQRENSEVSLELEKTAADLHIAVDKKREAIRLYKQMEIECTEKLAQQKHELEERERQSVEAVNEAKSVARQLRLDLAKERVDGLKRAEEKLRKEHQLDIAKNHQIGKNKGIAIANAYIDAAKEEDADLERSSHLASNVVIQSAQRIEAGLVIHEASLVSEGGGNGGLPGTQQEIRMREDIVEDREENSPRFLLGFSRKLR